MDVATGFGHGDGRCGDFAIAGLAIAAVFPLSLASPSATATSTSRSPSPSTAAGAWSRLSGATISLVWRGIPVCETRALPASASLRGHTRSSWGRSRDLIGSSHVFDHLLPSSFPSRWIRRGRSVLVRLVCSFADGSGRGRLSSRRCSSGYRCILLCLSVSGM